MSLPVIYKGLDEVKIQLFCLNYQILINMIRFQLPMICNLLYK